MENWVIAAYNKTSKEKQTNITIKQGKYDDSDDKETNKPRILIIHHAFHFGLLDWILCFNTFFLTLL